MNKYKLPYDAITDIYNILKSKNDMVSFTEHERSNVAHLIRQQNNNITTWLERIDKEVLVTLISTIRFLGSKHKIIDQIEDSIIQLIMKEIFEIEELIKQHSSIEEIINKYYKGKNIQRY